MGKLPAFPQSSFLSKWESAVPREEGGLGLAGVGQPLSEALGHHFSLEASLRAAQLAFSELEQRHSSLFDRSPDPVFTLDTVGRFTAANPACERACGYSTAELMGLSFQDICAPDRLQATLANFQRCLTGQFERLETAIICRDGRRVELLVTGGPIVLEGKMVALHCAARDITSLKNAEFALRRSEERWQLAMDAAHDGIWDWNPHTDEVYWSPQYLGMLGYLPDELPPGTGTLHALIHPDDKSRMWAAVDAHLRGETAEYEAEFRMRHRDGSYRWVLSRARAVRDPAGRPLRVVGCHTDITARKLAEQERDDLLAREQQARHELEDASRAKDHFLAVLSHELRTPLTPVLTSIQMMERDAALSGEHRESVLMIRRNVELEARLIDDLLDLTRISRGKLELFFEPTDLHAKIRHVIGICECEARSKQLALRVALDAPRYMVRADGARLQQLLWNLLKNAVKFTPDGGVIEISTSSVASTDDGAAQKVRIEVRDTGVGIDESLLPHIFEAFEQGGRQMTRRHGGLGLGLTISRWLVEAHSGTVAAHSDGASHGSLFIVELPLCDAVREETSATSIPRIDPPRPGRKLLLVEDNADTARSMKRLLRLMGYVVHTADCVSAGLRAAEGGAFDLLLCDIGLPDGSGLDLIRQLRAKAPVKAIALSGYGMDEDIQRSKDAGFLEHLTKPVNVQVLEESIARALATSV